MLILPDKPTIIVGILCSFAIINAYNAINFYHRKNQKNLKKWVDILGRRAYNGLAGEGRTPTQEQVETAGSARAGLP